MHKKIVREVRTLATLTQSVRGIEKDVSRLENIPTDVASVKESLSAVDTRLMGIEKDVSRLENIATDVASVKESLIKVEGKLSSTDSRLAQVEDKLAGVSTADQVSAIEQLIVETLKHIPSDPAVPSGP